MLAKRIAVADLSNEHPDVKPEGRVLMASHQNALYPFIDHYSSWDRLKRGVAWLLRFKGYLAGKLHGEQGFNQRIVKGGLSVEEIFAAERAVLTAVQQETFKDHFTRTSGSHSPLHKLCPVLVDGTLRVGGRLGNAHISEEAKRPIILPKKHHVTDIIIRKYHEEVVHAGREHVLASIRQKFWIVKGRVAVRRVLWNCFSCRPSAWEQRMADLPSERLIPDQPPFTFVSVDYFGPALVKQKRSHVKRYGCIFTCLTTRAIHIEIAHSLDTDSFISAMPRFIATRGRPQVVRRDNGSNFHAGERELRAALDGWNQQWIDKYASQQEIKWIFNPPATAHMGGVWERLVRSVKKILSVLLSEQVVGDESLLTVVAEAESILNSRSLKKKNKIVSFVVSFSKQDQYSRRLWRQVQYLADVFLRRWLREYLPTLQKRRNVVI